MFKSVQNIASPTRLHFFFLRLFFLRHSPISRQLILAYTYHGIHTYVVAQLRKLLMITSSLYCEREVVLNDMAVPYAQQVRRVFKQCMAHPHSVFYQKQLKLTCDFPFHYGRSPLPFYLNSSNKSNNNKQHQ